MEYLSPLDAGFLEAEDSDRHVSLAIGAVAIVEGPMPDWHSLVNRITERALSIPRLRQVLRTHRFDLNPPEWVDDPHLDVSHHIHRAALPQPGDDEALFRLAADAMEHRLDRERPLWECWIVEGLAHGRWALLMKVHHCIADGIATVNLLSGLSDDGNHDTFADQIRAASEAGHHQSLLSKMGLNPIGWAAGFARTAATATNVAVLALEGATEIVGGLLLPAARSSLVGPVSTMRRYSAAQVRLADVEMVCQAFGVTFNDVALAAVTSSFRAGLIRRQIQPKRTSLRTLVPVSVRGSDALGTPDNRVSIMLPFLPVDRSDPVDQLRTVHRRLGRAKVSGQRQGASMFVAAANVVPFPLSAWAVRTLTRLPQRGIVTLATNVPGPRHRLRVMDREVVRVLPVPPIALQLRVGVAILSYADQLVFGITADYDAAPDVDELARGIDEAVATLVAAVGSQSEQQAGAGRDR